MPFSRILLMFKPVPKFRNRLFFSPQFNLKRAWEGQYHTEMVFSCLIKGRYDMKYGDFPQAGEKNRT